MIGHIFKTSFPDLFLRCFNKRSFVNSDAFHYSWDFSFFSGHEDFIMHDLTWNNVIIDFFPFTLNNVQNVLYSNSSSLSTLYTSVLNGHRHLLSIHVYKGNYQLLGGRNCIDFDVYDFEFFISSCCPDMLDFKPIVKLLGG